MATSPSPHPSGAPPLEPGPPLSPSALPRIGIVVLNYNGLQHLERCFGSLRAADYPAERLQAVLVDNASSDESLNLMARDHAWVQVEANTENVGFSRGCNQGARLLSQSDNPPEVLVFLNNDIRIEPDFLAEVVGPIVRGEAQATTAKMLSWDGKRINSAGGGMNFHGMGIQKGYDEKPTAEHDQPSRSLFACGGAMAIDAAVFHDVGGFDEEFFAYYEDVDLGWRLWVLGHEIHYAPRAVCYHHHSSTSASFPVEGVRLLQVRNPMLACIKNYDDENLRRVLPAMLALGMRRLLIFSGLHGDPSFRIENHRPKRTGRLGRLREKLRRRVAGKYPLPRGAAADVLGINDLLGNWDHWMARRAEIQDRRQCPDAKILPLFDHPLWCIEKEEEGYVELQSGLTRLLGLDELFRGIEGPGRDPRH